MIEVNSPIVRTERCATAFQRMFWAFIFFIDFRLGFGNIHVDILPDFISWVVIASALTTIRDLSSTVSAFRCLILLNFAYPSCNLLISQHQFLQSSSSASSWQYWRLYLSGSYADSSWQWQMQWGVGKSGGRLISVENST